MREGADMVAAAEWGTGEVFLSMFWFFLFVIWIWLLVVVLGDVFRSRDLSGWAKALWSIFILVLPYLGVFVYLIARGGTMAERALTNAQAQDAELRRYMRSVNGGSGTTADELARLAELRDRGVIDEAEFERAKARTLSS